MSGGYRIRRARAGEAERLAEIEQAAGRLFTGLGLIDHMLDERLSVDLLEEALSAGRVWVAAGEDDTPVGFAVVTFADGEPHLEELDVHPDHGRRGLGARLVETVCAWAVAAGYRRVTLCTFRDVAWNGPFYRRGGFQDVPAEDWGPELRARREHEAARGFPMQKRVVMQKRL